MSRDMRCVVILWALNERKIVMCGQKIKQDSKGGVMRKLVLCGMLIVGYVFADEQEFESWHFGDSITSESRQEAELESKRKSQWESAQKSYKAFEWRLALGYDVNFNTYSNKK